MTAERDATNQAAAEYAKPTERDYMRQRRDYLAGCASRDPEVAALKARVAELEAENARLAVLGELVREGQKRGDYDSQQPSAGSDEEWVDQQCGALQFGPYLEGCGWEKRGYRHGYRYGLLEGLAEGRRKEREEGEKSVCDFAFKAGQTLGLTLSKIAEREQATAREGWDACKQNMVENFLRSESDEFFVDRDLMSFDDWWRQRGRK